MCAKSTRTCVATLCRSLDVICGKLPEYVRSPWQIPLLFYGKTLGRRTGGGGRGPAPHKNKSAVHVCASESEWERQIGIECLSRSPPSPNVFPNLLKTPATINHMWEMFYDVNILHWGVLLLTGVSRYPRASALSHPLTAQRPAPSDPQMTGLKTQTWWRNRTGAPSLHT